MASQRNSLGWTLFLFFVSGATSLVYEVLWTRRLSLTFGHTVLAVSTVLTVFMTGLALGSFLAGRWSDKERSRLLNEQSELGASRFLALYGYLEIFIGVWAVLSLLLLNGVETAFLSAARSGVEGKALYAVIFLGSFLVLLPPTTAMGATLPVFTQLLVATKEDVGEWLSRIYGWNTLGACCGAAAGGFLLLPVLGLRWAVISAALFNLVIGIVAIRAAKNPRDFSVEAQAPEPSLDGGTGGFLLPLSFGLSGFAAMVYQLGWTRGLILSIGSSTYSFSIILTAFLATLGLGSLIYKRGMGNREPKIWHLAALQLIIAISAWLATYGIGRLPELMVWAIPAMDRQFTSIVAFDFLVVLALMLFPTLAMGVTFPLVTHLYTEEIGSLGKRLGEAYAANTGGAILGSFTGGFLLIPTFGAHKALLGAVGLNLLVALLLALYDGSFSKPKVILATGLSVLALLFSPNWDPTKLSAGAGVYATARNFVFKPAFYKDGVSATITVGYNGPHTPYLKVNGKTDASISEGDMGHQVLTGLLSAALHPDPKKVAVVGLGSGVSLAGLVALDGIEKVYCAELSGAIVDVQSYFGPYVEHVANSPKLDLKVADGRSFIMGSPEKLDLIISQPPNPWMAGVGNLYTTDFYESCLSQLEPGGLMCQWFNLYVASAEDMDLVFSTFYSVFPEGRVFQIGHSDLFLVGSATPVALKRQRLKEVWDQPEVARWFLSIGLLKPDYLFATYVGSRAEVLDGLERARGGPYSGPLNTDDRPVLEYQAPLSMYVWSEEAGQLLDEFRSLVPKEFTEDQEVVGSSLIGRFQLGRTQGLKGEVERQLAAGLPAAPMVAALLSQKNEGPRAGEDFLKLISEQESGKTDIQILLGDFRRQAQQWEPALLLYERALKTPLPGSNYRVLMNAAECARYLGRNELALKYYLAASEITARPNPLYWAGEVALMGTQDESLAEKYFNQALERDEYDYSSLYRLALIAKNTGRPELALEMAERSYQVFPEFRQTVEVLRDLAIASGDRELARKYQKEVRELARLAAEKSQRAGH